MRQIVVLEKNDLDSLKEGKVLTLSVSGGKHIDVMLDTSGEKQAKTFREDGRSNREVVTEYLKTVSGPKSTAEISEGCGVNRITVSNVLHRLIDTKEVVPMDSGTINRNGKAGRVYSYVEQREVLNGK